jgi:hypothetical protein
MGPHYFEVRLCNLWLILSLIVRLQVLNCCWSDSSFISDLLQRGLLGFEQFLRFGVSEAVLPFSVRVLAFFRRIEVHKMRFRLFDRSLGRVSSITAVFLNNDNCSNPGTSRFRADSQTQDVLIWSDLVQLILGVVIQVLEEQLVVLPANEW